MNKEEFDNQYQYDPEHDIIGSGGFGTVYKAWDTVKKRHVAIKISQVKDIFGKFTLLNEVKLSEDIDDHTNVARYEFGLRVKQRPFITDYAVMAYYEEGNLDMVLRKRHNVLSPQEQYEIVEGLLEGIGHLHKENVIHRDLKLGNILMARTKQGQWRPKIADFGLSRQMDDYDASIANSAIGITMAYAAPEQITNTPIKKNVDLWALGVIIYRILMGDMPFAPIEGSNSTTATMEISRKITQLELPDNLKNVPEPYQTIIRRCWIKDTKDRVQSADELLIILKGKDASIYRDKSPSKPTTTRADIVAENAETVLYVPEAVESTIIAPPSVSKPISKPISNEVLDRDTTQILQDEEADEPSRSMPKWAWGALVLVVLLGIVWATGLFEGKQTPPLKSDPCDIAASPDSDCDGDGILNKNDKCPTEKGQNKEGCSTKTPVPVDKLKDTDGDGIPDVEDNCPTIKGTRAGHGCY